MPEDSQSSVSVELACGAIAGVMGQTFTYPLDAVRRQMQARFWHNFLCFKFLTNYAIL